MNSLKIETADGRTQFEPGDTLHVVAQWNLVERPDAMEIRLVWNTRGKGDPDIEIVDVVTISAPPAFDTYRGELQLPIEPYSFSGKLISLMWGLELVAIGSNESTRLDITIAPGGQEIVLQQGDLEP